MASAPDGIDSLKDLSDELQRNFSTMLDLGSKTKNLLTDIDKMADNYMSNIQVTLPNEEKENTLASIQSKFDAVKELGDDKVQLSIQTYELVDKRIRELDLQIARFKAERKLKDEIRDAAINAKRNLQTKKDGATITKAAPSASAVSDQTNPINSVANIAGRTYSPNGALVDGDMPIDPNEPTFCVCEDVSFGEMICCDNPDCAIEWFHFVCVDLVTKPKGEWYCPKCTKYMKKK